jgi:uncharacterized membrane protein YhaH (DUF805 family)
MTEGRIFINYRRGDSQGSAGRLYDRLLHHFEHERIFIDVDAIEPGVDFVASLDRQVSSCAAFIAVIGPGWLTALSADGHRRLDDPSDYVRVEIESALKRDIRVIPVLVDGASMPRASDLPPSLEALSRRNAFEIAHHRFAADCDDLAMAIKRALDMSPAVATASTAGVHPAAGPAPLSLLDPATTAQPPADRSSTKRLAANRRSWPEILFSFRGRISRKQFALGALIIVGVALAFGITISMIVEQDFGAADESTRAAIKRVSDLVEKQLFAAVEILTSWPIWALTLKRLHDIGQGWALFLPIVAIDVSTTVLDLLDQDDLSNRLLLIYLGVIVMLATIKGVPGANRYGPDPLAPAEIPPDRAKARTSTGAISRLAVLRACGRRQFRSAGDLNGTIGSSGSS